MVAVVAGTAVKGTITVATLMAVTVALAWAACC
jgi:hypothetical protein